MTIQELCRSTGLTPRKVEDLVESGLLEPALSDGGSREFSADQVERVRLIRALRGKGVALAQLAGRNLAFPGERFVIYNGRELRGCRDAAAAIAAVVRAKRWCSAVDLSSIREIDQ
jgi:hypothetical protein